jgi:2-amino-4-hydroxy-6-hydroxymethyldihydropteridine diphosphokinase
MTDVVASLGTNLGDRASYMGRMEQGLEQILGPPVVKSRLMETEPLGTTRDHPWYYNRLVRGTWGGTARELLAECQALEKRLGRTRPGKYAPRTADVDILLFGEVLINEPDLVVPHRHLLDRRFCVEGLLEVAAEWRVPGYGKTVRELARAMADDVRAQQIRYIEERKG